MAFRVVLEGQVGVRTSSTSWKEAPLWTHLTHTAGRRHSSLRVKARAAYRFPLYAIILQSVNPFVYS